MVLPGTVLVHRNSLPAIASGLRCFQVQDASCPRDWLSARHDLDPDELDNELAGAGWQFVHRAPIRTIAFGFNRSRIIQTAMRRLIADVERLKCDCLEVDEVTTSSFLGIRWVSISARARHIQLNPPLTHR
jgi:hypothetical protein